MFNSKWSIYIAGLLSGLIILAMVVGIGYGFYKKKGPVLEAAKVWYKQLVTKQREKKVSQPSVISPGVQKDGAKEIIVRINAKKRMEKVNPLIYGSNLVAHVEYQPYIERFVKDIGITCFRFPGEDPGYHWKTSQSDFNTLSTNAPLNKIENVIEFCRNSGTKLIIQVNIASGTPKEAAEWVEFMNKKEETRVEYWELGNEVYGDWDKGYMKPAKYAAVIKAFASAMKKADPLIKIGADWATSWTEDFNIKLLKLAGEYIDFVSYHWYPNHTSPNHKYEGKIHPDPEEMMANSLQIPAIVQRMRWLVEKYVPKRKDKIEFTFLEWDGAWDGPNSDFSPYSQEIVQWSLANAIFYADALGQFAQNGVAVAAQYMLQGIDFGLIRGWDKEAGWGGQPWDERTVRPKALAIKLLSKYFGNVLLASSVQGSPVYYKKTDWWPDSYVGEVPYVSAYASIEERSGDIALVLINKHQKENLKVKLFLEGVSVDEKARLFVLNGPDILAQNEGHPGNVMIKEYTIENFKPESLYTLPAHSVNLIRIEVKNGGN